MNFSTKDVLQLYVLDQNSAPTPISLKGGNALQYVITHADGKKETSDVIENIIKVKKVATATTTARKQANILLAANSLVAGQTYVVTLEFRDPVAEECSIQKTVGVIATAAMVADETKFYKAIGKELLLQTKNDVEPLFEIFAAASGGATTGSALTTAAAIDAATLTYGLCIVEAAPHWELGKWPERLSVMNIGVAPVWISGVQTDQWLDSCEIVASNKTLINSNELADLEYFAKGENGLPNAKVGWPYNIEPTLYVEPSATTVGASGYATLSIQCAYIGNGANNQKSEKTIIFATPVAYASLLTTIESAVNALPAVA